MDDRTAALFPRDLYGRIALALASLTFGPAVWLLAFALWFANNPGHDLPTRVFLLAVRELVTALALFFACGLVWALATPRWMERLLTRVVGQVAVGLAVFLVPFVGLAAWALVVG